MNLKSQFFLYLKTDGVMFLETFETKSVLVFGVVIRIIPTKL